MIDGLLAPPPRFAAQWGPFRPQAPSDEGGRAIKWAWFWSRRTRDVIIERMDWLIAS